MSDLVDFKKAVQEGDVYGACEAWRGVEQDYVSLKFLTQFQLLLDKHHVWKDYQGVQEVIRSRKDE